MTYRPLNMSGPSANSGQSRDGPDYFSYYAQAVAELFSENDGMTSDGSATASSSFDSCIGGGMPDYRKGRLHILLRQSVHDLTAEVDEMLDPVLRLSELRCQLKRTNIGVATNGDVRKGPQKKPRMSPSTSASLPIDSSPQVDDDFRLLQKTDPKLVEVITKKYSDELSATLKGMEQKLEELLDSVVFKRRPMTSVERQTLQKRIKKLPQENLSRVAEIFQRSRMKEDSAREIFVNLEEEDNRTLWRVYFYLQAIEKAKLLAM